MGAEMIPDNPRDNLKPHWKPPMMTYDELSKLVQLRSSQAYTKECAAKKLPPRKRDEAIRYAHKLRACVEIACDILGERCPDLEKEHRIKSLFIDLDWT